MTVLQALAREIAALRYEDLPPPVVAAAKQRVLDTLGCALGAFGTEPSRIVQRHVAALGGRPEATVLGSGARTSCLGATLANGTMIRALDCNDIYFGRSIGGHPSDNVAVALAVGERVGASGAAVLTALVVGYEVYCRFGDAQRPETRSPAWDHVCCSGYAAPAMAGKLLGLDEERLAHAMALGGFQGCSLGELRRGEIPMCKATANATLAQLGVQATLLAQEGLTGPLTVVEGEQGYCAGLGGAWDLDVLTEPFGEFRILRVTTKAYPAIGTSQSTLAAVLELRERHGVSPEQIREVLVELADVPLTRQQIGDAARLDPQTRETADHSLPFLVAVALLDGQITPQQFQGERWQEPSVRALMRRIRLTPDPELARHWPESYPARVTIRTADGTSLRTTVEYAPGHPRNPLSDAQVAEKFRRLASDVLPVSQMEAAIQRVLSLDKLEDIGRLLPLLIQPQGRS